MQYIIWKLSIVFKKQLVSRSIAALLYDKRFLSVVFSKQICINVTFLNCLSFYCLNFDCNTRMNISSQLFIILHFLLFCIKRLWNRTAAVSCLQIETHLISRILYCLESSLPFLYYYMIVLRIFTSLFSFLHLPSKTWFRHLCLWW